MRKKINKREALRGTSQKRSLPIQIRASTENADENTLSFVFVSNNNAGTRYDWGSGEYYTEVLDVSGATMENLNTFFKDHYHSVDSAVGSITNKRIENGQIVGDVRFGTDSESQVILSKYRENILTDVSIGYEIRDYTVTSNGANESDTVTVTNFDIFEVSAVGLGFDGGAKKRSEENLNEDNIMEKELLERLAKLEAMSKRNDDEKAELAKLRTMKLKAEKDELEAIKAENLELKRANEVASIASDFGERGARVLKSAPEKVTPEEFRSLILADFSKTEVNVQPHNKSDDASSRAKMIDAMVDGLAMRVGAKIKEPVKGAEVFRDATLIEVARQLVPNEDGAFLSKTAVAERAMVTGDFPLLLQSVGARVLVSEFEAQVGTYKAWIKEVDVPDFRVMTDVVSKMGGGRLTKRLENGDFKELSGAESKETWKIESFGNKFVLTREDLINDDLGAFTNLIAEFGTMAQNTANGLAYDLLQSTTYKMADGSGLYVASRNNSATDPLSSAAISAGRLAMSKHKSIDGKTNLRIVPKYLIVPPALEVTAREILGASAKLGADNVAVPNVNQNLYELIVDPEINSDTAWYLLAERRTLKMGFLAGTNRQPIFKINDSSLARTVFEGVFDIGVMVEDYKGLYRGNV